MARLILTSSFVFLLLTGAASAVDFQIEFVAQLVEIDRTSDDTTRLTLQLTPAFSISVIVTEETEVSDESDLEITSSDLAVGQRLKVRGIFTTAGILALQIEIAEDETQFEIKGIIDEVLDDRRIVVAGLTIEVPEGTEISDSEGNILAFSELEPGQRVTVEGENVEGRLVAEEVKVQRAITDIARVRFRGVIAEVRGDDGFLVNVAGDVPVLVHLTPETRIFGTLAVGVLVRVVGRLAPDLSVNATRVHVDQLLRLAPGRLRMRFDQTRRVEVILREASDGDVEVALESLNPEIAMPTTEAVIIPAGKINGAFHVQSFQLAGETEIAASLPAELGGLVVPLPVQVRSGDDEPDEDELELDFSPSSIRTGLGVSEVRLVLNRPAPEDLIVQLSQVGGAPDHVAFPSEVMIPQGERAALVMLDILSPQAVATILAMLPEAVGGDTAQLEIDLRPQPLRRISIRWSPDQISAEPGSTVVARLLLDQPAPPDFNVILTVMSQGSQFVQTLPSVVSVETGATEVEVEIQVANRPGQIRVRAAVPLQFGGRHDDLRIKIDN